MGIAETLRNHVRGKVSTDQQYRAAVDDTIKYHYFVIVPLSRSETSRANDGNALGQEVSALRIVAILYTPDEQAIANRSVITVPEHSPDSQARFLPLWSPAYESLQYPLLFIYVCTVELVGALALPLEVLRRSLQL